MSVRSKTIMQEVKEGALFLQQHKFGKRWKQVWCVLLKESSGSCSRLEIYNSKERQKPEHKVIQLVDCIRVTEVEMDRPHNHGAFLIETIDKTFIFAAQQHQEWTHTLCEVAFPVSDRKQMDDKVMVDNCLYSTRLAVRDFVVCVRRTTASERCRLQGEVLLRAGEDGLHLLDRKETVQWMWPYKLLRRFGRDKRKFSFEAGRRCESGEGRFEFDTREGDFLFQAIDAAIQQQGVSASCRQSLEEAAVYSEVRTTGGPACSPERQCPLHGPLEASQDFSEQSPELGCAPMHLSLGSRVSLPPAPTSLILQGQLTEDLVPPPCDQLYDVIDELSVSVAATKEPIYNDPIYDDPEEVKEAWRTMGTAENKHLYAIPKRLSRKRSITNPGQGGAAGVPGEKHAPDELHQETRP